MPKESGKEIRQETRESGGRGHSREALWPAAAVVWWGEVGVEERARMAPSPGPPLFGLRNPRGRIIRPPLGADNPPRIIRPPLGADNPAS
jgi:hypothetical protein